MLTGNKYSERVIIILELKNISKFYKSGNLIQTALDEVSITFRNNEFVSILGQSGAGKTTLLNIIGGLDQYDSGDLIIDGISTKKYKDKNWDSYRNHSIGFVFQNYNLIPHQNILSNVEMALTISGVNKEKRKTKAMEALEKVGLKEHAHKKPNQLSGGQMQRVAIARAIVNNPDIILADEPTGALDTETGVQVMEILKEIAQDRLVIMVTHNPELAYEYSTRIIKIQDGKIQEDSNPYTGNDENKHHTVHNKVSMSRLTSLLLSFKNLLTKKGRTVLTSFAGSIGIIGICLILAVSDGVNLYIKSVQKDAMASYPISITSTTVSSDLIEEFANKMQSVSINAKGEELIIPRNEIYASYRAAETGNKLNNSLVKNNLTEFKKYLEKADELENCLNETGIVYSYDTAFAVYTKDSNDEIRNTDSPVENSTSIIDSISSIYSEEAISSVSSIFSNLVSTKAVNFSEMLPSNDGLYSQTILDSYDIVAGHMPEKETDIVLILSANNTLTAEQMVQLGLMTQEQYNRKESVKLSYNEILGKTFSLVPTCENYKKSENAYEIITSETELYNKGIKLSVSGIIRPNANANSAIILTPIAYTSKLTQKIINTSNNSDIIIAQKSNPEINVLNNAPFVVPESEKINTIKNYFEAMSDNEKSSVMIQLIMSGKVEFDMDNIDYSAYMPDMSNIDIQSLIGSALPKNLSDKEKISAYNSWIKNISDEELNTLLQMMAPDSNAKQGIINKVRLSIMRGLLKNLSKDLKIQLYSLIQYKDIVGDGFDINSIMKSLSSQIDMTQLTSVNSDNMISVFFDNWLKEAPNDKLMNLYDVYIADNSYEGNLKKFGLIDEDSPSAINIYVDSFEAKDAVIKIIDEYNKTVEKEFKINYTDFISLLTTSLTSIINAISYVLIAFVGVSLIVSSIMIGIITNISVLERTSEIGLLRALGASKKNISQIFNAETFIIGSLSGLIGIGISYLLIIPINVLADRLTHIDELRATLQPQYALILIVVSSIVTILGGLYPAKKASSCDPVKALRSE